MAYRRLGRTNLSVSSVGIGTCQLRLVPERQALETLLAAFRQGVNLVHTAPDYEGADRLVARAIREAGMQGSIHVCSQGWGERDFFERLFEETCEVLGQERLELFGIASLYDLETLGENVWGAGGTVEFLLRKREEGRLGHIFCTTHGPLWHLRDRLERDVFDAVMLSYNPLGFHVLSFNPRTLFDVARRPPGMQGEWEYEDVPRMRDEIFPLLRARDIGLMVMKPLAGGLLCPAKAFPRPVEVAAAAQPSAEEVLRYILLDPAVSSVVPGTASVDEALENARAGFVPAGMDEEARARVEARAAGLLTSVCSRCGGCDDTCSHSLPVSWLFRSAYISLSPSTVFENDDQLQYFRLHPQPRSTCSTCQDVTCHCPFGIDIGAALSSLHAGVNQLAESGVVPDASWKGPRYSDRERSAALLMKDIPGRARPGEAARVRLAFRNTGTRTWLRQARDGSPAVCLSLRLDGRSREPVPLRRDVPPGERVHFAFDLQAPPGPGTYAVKIDLVEGEGVPFGPEGGGRVEATLVVA
jgi:predicted aldo/keto reductase-like oxidoreductase